MDFQTDNCSFDFTNIPELQTDLNDLFPDVQFFDYLSNGCDNFQLPDCKDDFWSSVSDLAGPALENYKQKEDPYLSEFPIDLLTNKLEAQLGSTKENHSANTNTAVSCESGFGLESFDSNLELNDSLLTEDVSMVINGHNLADRSYQKSNDQLLLSKSYDRVIHTAYKEKCALKNAANCSKFGSSLLHNLQKSSMPRNSDDNIVKSEISQPDNSDSVIMQLLRSPLPHKPTSIIMHLLRSPQPVKDIARLYGSKIFPKTAPITVAAPAAKTTRSRSNFKRTKNLEASGEVPTQIRTKRMFKELENELKKHVSSYGTKRNMSNARTRNHLDNGEMRSADVARYRRKRQVTGRRSYKQNSKVGRYVTENLTPSKALHISGPICSIAESLHLYDHDYCVPHEKKFRIKLENADVSTLFPGDNEKHPEYSVDLQQEENKSMEDGNTNCYDFIEDGIGSLGEETIIAPQISSNKHILSLLLDESSQSSNSSGVFSGQSSSAVSSRATSPAPAVKVLKKAISYAGSKTSQEMKSVDSDGLSDMSQHVARHKETASLYMDNSDSRHQSIAVCFKKISVVKKGLDEHGGDAKRKNSTCEDIALKNSKRKKKKKMSFENPDVLGLCFDVSAQLENSERNQCGELTVAGRERRILYVSKIEENVKKEDFKKRFEQFGPIKDVNLHFRKHGDNYGFVTYYHMEDVFRAMKHGNDNPRLPQYSYGIGGRREFCGRTYLDLDSFRDDGETADWSKRHNVTSVSTNDSYEAMLKRFQMDTQQRRSNKATNTATTM